MLRAKRPKVLAKWYRDHLGIPVEGQMAIYGWKRPTAAGAKGHTVWAVLGAGEYDFGRKDAQVLINYRVRDLDAVLAALRREGVSVEPEVAATEIGRFGWAKDPEGNRFELWEPPKRHRTADRSTPMA